MGPGNTPGSSPDDVLDAPSDRELLDRHRQGDPDAFGEVVRRHRNRLWAVALRTAGDPEEAADALQDALVSAFRAGRGSSASGYRGEAAVTTWLHRVVVNACLDRARRRRARDTVPLPTAESGEDLVPAPGDPVGAREDAVDIATALATLPPDQRAAIVLVDVQGIAVRDAAELLGVAEGTVKSRCSRGRARLAVLLAPGRSADAGPGRDGTTAPPAASQRSTSDHVEEERAR
ncbi:RNA polymerase sigma factor SigM [Motilibacter aurantiacus]|uniref:RNA polymerase sigma factor SigM n=1 Tax=Motilibacter aurantiacus TaxID=2714955 RepID=UPI001409D31D|nr:RNA polymerase sigma factor SigM [Motilibacter aurantiacus]